MQPRQLAYKLMSRYSFGSIQKTVAFKILGLQTNAQPFEVKEAYLKLSKKFHPDVSSIINAAEHFKIINEAYRLLKKEAADEEIFSSGINKNPSYNYEDNSEDSEIFRKQNMQKNQKNDKVERNNFSSRRGLDTETQFNQSHSHSHESKKNRGHAQQCLKSRMAQTFKQ